LLIKRVREQNMRGKGAATQPGINTRTAYKWLERYKEGGEAALGT
jgi:transposase